MSLPTAGCSLNLLLINLRFRQATSHELTVFCVDTILAVFFANDQSHHPQHCANIQPVYLSQKIAHETPPHPELVPWFVYTLLHHAPDTAIGPTLDLKTWLLAGWLHVMINKSGVSRDRRCAGAFLFEDIRRRTRSQQCNAADHWQHAVPALACVSIILPVDFKSRFNEN